jgi:phage terminase large subunit-like protein
MARTHLGATVDPEIRRDVAEQAEREGISFSEAVNRRLGAVKPPSRVQKRRWKWNLHDFERFAIGSGDWPGLTLPEGTPFHIEGHMKLVLREVFRPKLVELLTLLPKGNQKTATLAALAVFHVLSVPNARCYIGAADKIQAQEMYDFASWFAGPPEPDEETPEDDLRAYEFLMQELKVRLSTREIRSERDRGFIRVLASDDSKQGGKRQSFNPTLALIDEHHSHENPNLYVDMRTSVFKRGGKLLGITTAGFDQESVLGVIRRGFYAVQEKGGTLETGLKADRYGTARKHKDGRLTIARQADGRGVMLEWMSHEGETDDPKKIKLANPASSVTVESIEDAMNAPGISPWHFLRYRCNIWTLGFESWLPEGAWQKLSEPTLTIPDGADVYVAVDMGRYKDCAAVVLVQPRGEVPAAVKLAGLWRGSRDDPPPYSAVKKVIRQLDERYRMLACGFDPRYFDQAAEELKSDGLPMLKFDQSNERMCPAAANLREVILKGNLRHDGDPRLLAHVTAGTTKDVGTNEWRIEKSSKPGAPPVDALIALAMAHQLAFFNKRPVQPVFEALA